MTSGGNNFNDFPESTYQLVHDQGFGGLSPPSTTPMEAMQLRSESCVLHLTKWTSVILHVDVMDRQSHCMWSYVKFRQNSVTKNSKSIQIGWFLTWVVQKIQNLDVSETPYWWEKFSYRLSLVWNSKLGPFIALSITSMYSTMQMRQLVVWVHLWQLMLVINITLSSRQNCCFVQFTCIKTTECYR